MQMLKMNENEANKGIENQVLRRMVFRYVVTGVSSVLAQFGVLSFLVEGFNVDPTLSSGVGFFVGCLVQYFMLYYWAFNSTAKHFVVALKYTMVILFTGILNVVLFWMLTEGLGLWYLFSQVFSTIVIAFLNLIINKYYTFANL
jgi:putative flippase GtrA